MKVLDLFSGIGGFSVGLEKAGFETIAFCEIDPYCQAVLRKHWPGVPIFTDVRDITARELEARQLIPDVICGGFPCQPFSVAGKQRGAEDDRHLWPELFRIVKEVRPDWCIFENVTGLIKLGIDEVLSDLEAQDYSTGTFVIPACGVDAPHRRDRVWIVAHSNRSADRRTSRQDEEADGEISQRNDSGVTDQPSQICTPNVGNTKHDGLFAPEVKGKSGKTSNWSQEGKKKTKQFKRAGEPRDNESLAYPNGDDGRHGRSTKSQGRKARVEHRSGSERQPIGKPHENVAYTDSAHFKRGGLSSRVHQENQNIDSGSYNIREQATQFWKPEPSVGRVANGIPNRSHRIKALGNAVVPQIPEEIGRIIMQVENG